MKLAELTPLRKRRVVSYLTLPSMMAISSGNFFATEDTETTEFLVSFVFLANFAPKASFVTNLCLRPQGHQNGLLMRLTKRVQQLTIERKIVRAKFYDVFWMMAISSGNFFATEAEK